MSKTSKAFSAESNVDRIGRALERRASNAPGPMADRRTKRLKTRTAVRRQAIKMASF